MFKRLEHFTSNILSAKSGLISSGPSMGEPMNEITSIVMTTLLGAFLGLLIGIVGLPVFRFASFMIGRQWGGANWVIVLTVLGAALFAFLAIIDGEEPQF